MAGKTFRLKRGFYLRPTLEVARDLIGKELVFENGGKRLAARLMEVEAYIGEDDPACHAAVGPTDRNRVMYGRGGFSYIYFIYGMYYCLNVVTEKAGFPAAVLIRGAVPLEGIEIMKSHFDQPCSGRLTDGPGKLCRAFGLTREHNGLDLVNGPLYLIDSGYEPSGIEHSGRIGIKKGTGRLWRFFEPSDHISVKRVKTV
nr:DNA-3-methyladenine glycosylase [candidate division Zixibacteria bacterium]